ncbi:putative ribonuclease H protein At1g65750 [Quercus suber]|uniref:putative ribonuclease H protein At1g65750 n=1 Tax=Quercus suber TaxID=58331 RepID=UPI0032DE65F0
MKSGYRLLSEEDMKDSPSSSNLSPTKRIWKGIWSLKTPNKVKTLLWRAGTDSLPSKASLLKRKVVCNDLCSECKLESESSFHALWVCCVVAQVWEQKFAWLCKLLASSGPDSRASAPSGWLPPPKDWVKVNFDKATFQKDYIAGLGCFVRNDEGLVMATFSQIIPLPTSIEMVEVLAARSAIAFAKDLSLKQVIFEGDLETIMRPLSKGGFDSSSYGHITRDIKFLSHGFQNCSFCHTLRHGNKVAHSLARSACKFSHFHVWMEDLPPDSVPLYLSDLP